MSHHRFGAHYQARRGPGPLGGPAVPSARRRVDRRPARRIGRPAGSDLSAGRGVPEPAARDRGGPLSATRRTVGFRSTAGRGSARRIGPAVRRRCGGRLPKNSLRPAFQCVGFALRGERAGSARPLTLQSSSRIIGRCDTGIRTSTSTRRSAKRSRWDGASRSPKATHGDCSGVRKRAGKAAGSPCFPRQGSRNTMPDGCGR